MVWALWSAYFTRNASCDLIASLLSSVAPVSSPFRSGSAGSISRSASVPGIPPALGQSSMCASAQIGHAGVGWHGFQVQHSHPADISHSHSRISGSHWKSGHLHPRLSALRAFSRVRRAFFFLTDVQFPGNLLCNCPSSSTVIASNRNNPVCKRVYAHWSYG